MTLEHRVQPLCDPHLKAKLVALPGQGIQWTLLTDLSLQTTVQALHHFSCPTKAGKLIHSPYLLLSIVSCLISWSEQYYRPNGHKRHIWNILTIADYTFFSDVLAIISQDRLLSRLQTSPSKFKKIEILQNIFFNHYGMKLEISNRRKAGRSHEYMKIKQHAPKQSINQKRN